MKRDGMKWRLTKCVECFGVVESKINGTMGKVAKFLILPTGYLGLLIAVSLGVFQLQLIWEQNHLPPGGIMLDWSPYNHFLAQALNWWVPFSILVCCASILLATKFKLCKALICGWCLHAVSIVGLVSLGAWVFTVPLPGGGGVWWMLWNRL